MQLCSKHQQACQLMLGAGVIRTSGLKSIISKHLAVSCQDRRQVEGDKGGGAAREVLKAGMRSRQQRAQATEPGRM